MNDIFGRALLDYQNNDYTEDIVTKSSLDEEDILPLPYLFRIFDEMPPIEQKALQLCKGKVLDIGAGAGSHSLYLQNKGFDVTALDSSKGSTDVCKLRGIKKAVHGSLLNYADSSFDTLLMLMNGIGLVGEIGSLTDYFSHLKSLLKPKGQILLDSSDIIYMFEEDEDGGIWVPDQNYYGEVEFTMLYKGKSGLPFKWLYLDFQTLTNAAEASGLNCELVLEGEHYDYLARLWRK
ncbi:class I SAM-dependent methyltransferase [Euzebyella marina]|uniref:Class I SAM-dependent methyltransferase n=1 Tax=Euzebyella marina TaxID=1761453 RepID=A0A3G2L9K3_9FLAO|nr:class I SAM-dependent methyltransferase [Euzebyella marina]AYN68936.1 class I SAM-dependent methyltransferase [Euzebyella marina]